MDNHSLLCYNSYMANKQRQFSSAVEGYKVTFKHDANFTNYEAFIVGLGLRARGESLVEVNKKVREVIQANKKK